MITYFKKHLYIFSIILIGLAVYLNSLGNGFVWDDKQQILDNIFIHNFSNLFMFFTGSTFYQGSQNLQGLYYRPITTTIFSFLYFLFGPNAFPFHFVSVSLHILNAILVFLLFKKLFSKNVAFFLSLIFLVHPINTEVADYISSLGDLLSFSFGMTAFLLFIEKKRVSLKKILLITTLSLVSLLSKETGSLFLLAAFIYRTLYFREYKYWAIPVVSSISIYIFLRTFVAKIQTHNETFVPIMGASTIEKVITVPKIFVYYINNFFFPIPLAISQQWVVRTINFTDFYLPLIEIAILISILSFIFTQIKKDKETKLLNTFLFSLGIFLTGVIAHLHIITLFETAADRWFYVPSIGLLGLIGIAVALLAKYAKSFPKYFILTLAITLISILAIRTFVRNFGAGSQNTSF